MLIAMHGLRVNSKRAAGGSLRSGNAKPNQRMRCRKGFARYSLSIGKNDLCGLCQNLRESWILPVVSLVGLKLLVFEVEP